VAHELSRICAEVLGELAQRALDHSIDRLALRHRETSRDRGDEPIGHSPQL
jgi:hypothetical protein